MSDMSNLYRAYSAVHSVEIKEELQQNRDLISEMNMSQVLQSDLVEVCEEIVEGLFEYGLDLDDACGVISALLEEVSEGNSNELREGKIDQIAEAFGTVVDTVTDKAERNCEEDFLLYRQNKPLTEKWNNKVSHEVGNAKLHASLIHEDRNQIKFGLIEMLSDIMELWSDDKQEDDVENTPTRGVGAKAGSPGKKDDPAKNKRMAASAKDPLQKMRDMNRTSKGLDRIGTAVKSVQDKPEKKTDDDAAAKRRAKLKAKFGKSINTGMREEVSELRQGWGDAYATIYEKKKLDAVGKEDDDVDNDGDSDSSDKYLKKRRKAIGKAMGKSVSKDEEDDNGDGGMSEGVTFSEVELARIEEIVNSWED